MRAFARIFLFAFALVAGLLLSVLGFASVKKYRGNQAQFRTMRSDPDFVRSKGGTANDDYVLLIWRSESYVEYYSWRQETDRDADDRLTLLACGILWMATVGGFVAFMHVIAEPRKPRPERT